MKRFLWIFVITCILGVLAALPTISSVSAAQKDETGNKTPEVNQANATASLSASIENAGHGFLPAGSLDSIIDAYQSQSTRIEQTVYDVDLFKICLLMRPNGSLLSLSISSAPNDLYGINNWWPVENLQKVNDELIYAIYRVRDHQNNIHSMYLFFKPLHPAYNEAAPDAEYWVLTGHVFFINKTLSLSDFASINVGCTFEDVSQIDPAAVVQRSESTYPENTDAVPRITEFKTYHYLTDGILALSFTFNEESSAFLVSAVDFDKTFCETAKTHEMPLTINPSDFPKQLINDK